MAAGMLLAVLVGWRYWGLDGATWAAGVCFVVGLLGNIGSYFIEKRLYRRLDGFERKADKFMDEVATLGEAMRRQQRQCDDRNRPQDPSLQTESRWAAEANKTWQAVRACLVERWDCANV